MITISQGWKVWTSSWRSTRLSDAAEWMWRLNLFARSYGSRHPITDQIYELKNELIQYLYQHGYAVEVTKTFQKRMCHSCGGTGEFWTGDECLKCDGTGVYAVTNLYAFRFLVEGRRYSWHQLEKLVDYEITLTDPRPQEYQEPTRAEAILSLEEAYRGCCAVWWILAWHGVLAEFQLFRETWAWLKSRLTFRRRDDAPF